MIEDATTTRIRNYSFCLFSNGSEGITLYAMVEEAIERAYKEHKFKAKVSTKEFSRKTIITMANWLKEKGHFNVIYNERRHKLKVSWNIWNNNEG